MHDDTDSVESTSEVHGTGEAEGSGNEEETRALPSFEELGLKQEILDALTEMGFEQPTEVQAQAIPLALTGRDLVVKSRTGSGKTAAFCIPLCQALVDGDKKQAQALVLEPTRELAIQVAEECRRIGAGSGLSVTAVYGGAAIDPQIKTLRAGAQIIAGTPGRVLDHIRRGTLDTSGIRLLVLDEGDEMLSMGFLEEIGNIIDRLPAREQTLLFSATVPDEMERIITRYLSEPEYVDLSSDYVGAKEVNHVFYLVSGGDRPRELLRILEYENPRLALIFCNTREETASVAEFLHQQGFNAEGISSDLSQREREKVMARMRAGELQFLVATDVAARGIDIADITHVFNFTFPESADVYVHRTGRTGRAGKSGVAISLVSPREIGSFYYLKLIHKIYPEERQLPSAQEVVARREAEVYERLRRYFGGRAATDEYRRVARRVLSTPAGESIIALALAEVEQKARAREEQEGGSAEEDRRQARRRSRISNEAQTAVGRAQAGIRERRRERRSGGGDGDRRGGRRGASDEDDRRPRRSRRRRDEEPGPERDDARRGRRQVTTADGEVETYERLDPAEVGGGRDGEGEAPRRTRRRGPPVIPPGMARLYVNVGRRQRVAAEDLARHLQEAAGIAGDRVAGVDVLDRHSYVTIPEELADAAVERLDGSTLGERTIKVERARPPRRP